LCCSLAPAEEAKEDINAKRAELRLRIKARELSAANVRAQAAQPPPIGQAAADLTVQMSG